MNLSDYPACIMRTVASVAGIGIDLAHVPFPGPCIRQWIHFDKTVGYRTDQPGKDPRTLTS
jgi:hypothetical protein